MGFPWMNNPVKVVPQLLVALVGSLGYFSMGAVRAWGSPGLPSLNRTREFEMDDNDFKWISSLPMFGAIFGSLIINTPMTIFGRKKALIGHYFLFILGFFITGLTCYGKNKIMLYVGRIFMGFANGCTTPATQIYVTECASPRIRGRLGSLTASSLALGILMTYIVGAFVEWNVLAYVFGSLCVGFLVMSFYIPESPAWLLSKGREAEAREALQSLRGEPTNIDAEIERMKANQARMQLSSTKKRNNLKELFTGPVLKPLGISLGLMFFQQTTGVGVLIFYTVSIFETAGSTIDGRYATIIVGAVQLVFTAASGFLVDRFGRRFLFLLSALASTVPLATMGIFFRCQREWGEEVASESLGWLPLASLIVLFITNAVGCSNVPFIVMGEMFPLKHRPLLGAISSSFNLLSLFLIVLFFPDMMRDWGKDVTFYFFLVCTLCGALFVYFLLPETKGKTMEEVERMFSSKKEAKVPPKSIELRSPVHYTMANTTDPSVAQDTTSILMSREEDQ